MRRGRFVRAIDRVGESEGAGQVRIERRSIHRAGQRRLGRKADLVGHLRLDLARTVLGLRARQIQPAVDQRLPKRARVGEKDTDPAVLDTTRRPRILAGNADALPVTPHYNAALHRGEIVRGKRTRWIHFDPRPCLMPPDWSGGYTSIFAIQQGEEQSEAAAADATKEADRPAAA